MPTKIALKEPEPEPEFDPDIECDDEEEYEEEEEEFDMAGILASMFTTEEGDNVATALVTVGNHLEKMSKIMDTQNKILLKILTQLSIKKEES